ncbi:MAG: glycosyltransferase family 39 protein, partial [Candidatus Peribacter sp.]|nr:glycosyltransferase family 39 protein [Candidatus Peribacter sp.]
MVWPQSTHGTYEIGTTVSAFNPPLFLQNAPRGNIAIVETMVLSPWHPHLYYFGLDNCLQSLTVNDIPQPIPQDFCDGHRDNVIDLGSVLHAGTNIISMTVHNGGGPAGVHIRVANHDSLRLLLLSFFILTFSTYFCFLLYRSNTNERLFLLFLLAVIVRVIYVSVTPHSVRANDVSGHVAYIRFIASNWTLPDAHDGWEYYQPPVYYLISALLMKAGWLLHLRDHVVFLSLQIFSLVSSIGVLAASLWIGTMLFVKKQRTRLLYFFAIPATLPAIIFFSSRINNDILLSLFSALALAFLLRWWQRRTVGDWLLFGLFVGIGSITKSNMLLLLPAGLLCLVAAKDLAWRKKILLFLILCAVMLILGGWYYVPRILTESDQRSIIVGNIDRMTGAIPHRAGFFAVFNPWAMLRYPFNDPIGFEARRGYLWEYFFRTLLYGEYPFEKHYVPFAILMLSSALCVLPIFFWNLVADIRRWSTSPSFPLWVTFLFQIIGLASLRYFSPFSCSADFRYVAVSLIPLSYYAVASPRSLPAFLSHVRDKFLILFF